MNYNTISLIVMNNNLANDPNYIKTVDSLKIEINLRIKDAEKNQKVWVDS